MLESLSASSSAPRPKADPSAEERTPKLGCPRDGIDGKDLTKWVQKLSEEPLILGGQLSSKLGVVRKKFGLNDRAGYTRDLRKRGVSLKSFLDFGRKTLEMHGKSFPSVSYLFSNSEDLLRRQLSPDRWQQYVEDLLCLKRL